MSPDARPSLAPQTWPRLALAAGPLVVGVGAPGWRMIVNARPAPPFHFDARKHAHGPTGASRPSRVPAGPAGWARVSGQG
jgi:hypothetical protein